MPDLTVRNPSLDLYREAIGKLAADHGHLLINADFWTSKPFEPYNTRDGLHLSAGAHYRWTNYDNGDDH